MKKITIFLAGIVVTLSSAGVALSQTQRPAPFECRDCCLRGIDMGVEEYLGRNLSGAILSHTDLRDANLSNIVFLDADFRHADLRNTRLTNTFFTGNANLENADLRGANMNDTFFTGANLRNADLRGAILTKGSLEGADLTGANIEGFEMIDPFFCETIMPDGTVRNDSCL